MPITPDNWTVRLLRVLADKIRQIITLFLVPIAVFFAFKGLITSKLVEVLVNPILSKYEASILDIVFIILLLLALYIPLLFKIIRHQISIPNTWLFSLITVQTIYAYYRLIANDFNFYSVCHRDGLAVLDLFILPLTAITTLSLIYAIRGLTKEKPIDIKNEGFEIDEPKISFDNDVLKRTKFIVEIHKLISSTHSPNGSFPIGIVSRWGAGKTSFLNSLIAKFDKNTVIIIELNVWKSRTPTQIIDNFFEQFIEQLSKESFTLNRALSKYSDKLLKGFQSDQFAAIRNIADFFNGSSSNENNYDDVNAEIKKLGKKIVVTIDDIDRLDHSEVDEVLRLVRNTANFSNTFFLVAYDRNYLPSYAESGTNAFPMPVWQIS